VTRPADTSEGGQDLIATSSPESQDEALREIGNALPAAVVLERLAVGTVLLGTGLPFGKASALLRETRPVFVRHLCPAETAVRLEGTPGDLDLIVSAAMTFRDRFDAARKFSVQSRIVSDDKARHLRTFDINKRISDSLAGGGLSLDTRRPGQVLSVVCVPGLSTAWIGLSETPDNLSPWPGGMMRLSKSDGLISRAELKLEEAVKTFGLDLPGPGRRALDLGAAPGGWTRILRKAGYAVTAVDPADLHPDLKRDPLVTHARTTLQEFLADRETRPGSFDLITNDMRMDAVDSAGLMLSARPLLKKGGFGVMTLKLRERSMARDIARASDILGRLYAVRSVRQLFHNRLEVTVLLGTGTPRDPV
jgi:23S rRNA (cytidine2498-2'-O)-methyltransferase